MFYKIYRPVFKELGSLIAEFWSSILISVMRPNFWSLGRHVGSEHSVSFTPEEAMNHICTSIYLSAHPIAVPRKQLDCEPKERNESVND